MSNKVVIAGGSGLIGSALASALVARGGEEVIVLSRAARSPRAGVRFVSWDGVESGPWVEELDGAKAVVNLCGENVGRGRWTSARKRRITASRTDPGRVIADATLSLGQPPGVLIQASGVGFYGPGEGPVDEATGPGRDFLARLAVEWEACSEAATIRRVCLRFGVVLSRDGGALGQILQPFRLFAGGPIASGRQWLPWVHIDDAVAVLLLAIDTDDLSGPVNVVAPEAVRNGDFARIAGQVLGRPAFFRVPRAIMTLALGEQATIVCDGQQAIPAVLTERGFRFRFPALREALMDLTAR